MSTGILRGRDKGTLAHIDLTGATVFYLRAPKLLAGKLLFEGSLGQSINVFVELPAEEDGEDWLIANLTSGGFSITFRAASGGSGVQVPAGAQVSVYWSGTEIVGIGAVGTVLAAGGGASAFNPVISNPANGDVISWDGQAWINTPAGGGSLAGAVILAPTTDGRNTIQPTGNAICALKVKRFSAAHSESMFEVQTETGVILAEFNPSGRLQLTDVDDGQLTGANGFRMIATTAARGAGLQIGNADTGSTQVWQMYAKGGTTSFVIGRHQVRDNIHFLGGQASIYIPGTNAGTTAPAGSYSLRIDSGEVGFVPLILQGILNQSADLQLWRDNTPTNVMRVTSGGRLEVGSTAGTARLYVRDDANAELAIFEGQGALSSVFVKVGAGGQAAALRVYPGIAASAGTTIVQNGGLILRGHYWNGAASLPLDGQVRLRIDDTTPEYYLVVTMEGIDCIQFRGSDGAVIISPNLDPGAPVEKFVVNTESRFIRDIRLSGNTNVELATTGGGTKWGTASNQLQAWWGNAGVVRQSLTGSSVAERLANLEEILGTLYGLINPVIPTTNMMWDFDSAAITPQTDNTTLSTWPDSAPTPHNMSSPGAAGNAFKYRTAASAAAINGQAVVQTVAGDQAEIGFPNFSPAINDASFTHYYLGRYSNGGSTTGILVYSFEADAIRLYLDGDVVGVNQVGWEFDVGAGPVDVDIAVSVTGVQVIAFVFDKTAGNGKVYRNGTQIGTTSTNVGGSGAGNGFDWGATARIEFFATAGGVATLVGEHRRLIGYSVAHDAATVASISAALKALGGIA